MTILLTTVSTPEIFRGHNNFVITFQKRAKEKRTEQIIVRVTPTDKKKIQVLAKLYCDGNVSRLVMTWLERHRSFVK